MTNQLVQHSSKSQEHYTPQFILNAVYKTLGFIGLDPASCELANQRVRAKHYFTKEEDGLNKEWFGSVFCNPPGGKVGNKSLNKLFWYKLVDEWLSGRVKEAVFLAYSIELLQTSQFNPDTRYHAGSYSLCIPKKRIAYIDQFGNEQKSPTHAGVVIYVPNKENYKKSIQNFQKQFDEIGTTIDRFINANYNRHQTEVLINDKYIFSSS